jgi:hypothetical protein
LVRANRTGAMDRTVEVPRGVAERAVRLRRHRARGEGAPV